MGPASPGSWFASRPGLPRLWQPHSHLCLCHQAAFLPVRLYVQMPSPQRQHQSLDLEPTLTQRPNLIPSAKDPLSRQGHGHRFLVDMNLGETLFNSAEPPWKGIHLHQAGKMGQGQGQGPKC